MAEDYIQVALDGAGKKTKQVLVEGVVQADGTVADVYVTCVVATDRSGRAIDHDAVVGELRSIKRLIRRFCFAFGEMTENAELTLGLDEDDGPE